MWRSLIKECREGQTYKNTNDEKYVVLDKVVNKDRILFAHIKNNEFVQYVVAYGTEIDDNCRISWINGGYFDYENRNNANKYLRRE